MKTALEARLMKTDLEAVGVVTLIAVIAKQQFSLVVVGAANLTRLKTSHMSENITHV